MSPSDFRERLSAYLDDRLSADEAREFLAWLESHPAAWREAEESRRVWAILSAYRDEPVPEGFADRVVSRLRAEGEAVAVRSPAGMPALALLSPRRARVLAVAAGLVAALGVGVVCGRLSGSGASGSKDGTVAAINAVPAGLLDRLDENDLLELAS